MWTPVWNPSITFDSTLSKWLNYGEQMFFEWVEVCHDYISLTRWPPDLELETHDKSVVIQSLKLMNDWNAVACWLNSQSCCTSILSKCSSEKRSAWTIVSTKTPPLLKYRESRNHFFMSNRDTLSIFLFLMFFNSTDMKDTIILSNK